MPKGCLPRVIPMLHYSAKRHNDKRIAIFGHKIEFWVSLRGNYGQRNPQQYWILSKYIEYQ